MGGAGDKDDLCSPPLCLFRQGKAHQTRGGIADETDGIKPLLGGTGGYDEGDSLKCFFLPRMSKQTEAIRSGEASLPFPSAPQAK